MSRALRALAALGTSGFPWAAPDADAWEVSARRAVLARWPLALRPIAAVAMALAWPPVSLIAAWRLGRMGPPGFWHRAWRTALWSSTPPADFAAFQLWRPSTPRQGWRPGADTARWLTHQTNPEVAGMLADKSRATAWFAKIGLPHVPILSRPEPRDLVTKPPRGMAGRGIKLWTWADGVYRPRPGFGGAPGAPCPPDALAEEARREGLLIQPAIPPHPKLGPAIARIVTRRRAGRARLADALVQCPAEGDFCSHFGPYRLVEEGQIQPPGPGQESAIFGPPAPIAAEGATLPGWAGLTAKLCAAHETLPPPVPLIGWDVIWSPDGPQVLEANTGIGLTLFQADRLAPACYPELGDGT